MMAPLSKERAVAPDSRGPTPAADEIGFSHLERAGDLDGLWEVFDPTLMVDPASSFYVPRKEAGLNKLVFRLERITGPMHAFLCGHGGSGKTTELNRLRRDSRIQERYLPIYLTVQQFGAEAVYLTHDALLVEIARELVRQGTSYGMDPELAKELDAWGQQVVRTFLHDETALGEVGSRADAWLAFFKAQLTTRREWKTEKKLILEPRVQDLVQLVNRMAQNLKNRAGRELLVIVDDLEKGDSDAHRDMHMRLFQEHYDVLVQPWFSIIYTLPIYFRALPGRRIPSEQLFAFSAVRLYEQVEKRGDRPNLNFEGTEYQLMHRFVVSRVANMLLFAGDTLDELLRIGGGLFRETARVIQDAAFYAEMRGSSRIELEDVENVFNQVKKEYQPMIRGEAVKILKAVLSSAEGWIPGVEPYLQSRAVVEYENGDLWLDLRYTLKAYVRGLADG